VKSIPSGWLILSILLVWLFAGAGPATAVPEPLLLIVLMSFSVF